MLEGIKCIVTQWYNRHKTDKITVKGHTIILIIIYTIVAVFFSGEEIWTSKEYNTSINTMKTKQ